MEVVFTIIQWLGGGNKLCYSQCAFDKSLAHNTDITQVVSQVTLCVMTSPFGDYREAQRTWKKSADLHFYSGLNNTNIHQTLLHTDRFPKVQLCIKDYEGETIEQHLQHKASHVRSTVSS